MSKSKGPRTRGGDSTEESLRGKNRSLQKTIRQLQQRIRQLEQQLSLPSTVISPDHEELPKAEIKLTCPSCGKGEMEAVEWFRPGAPIKVLRCGLCKHQIKQK